MYNPGGDLTNNEFLQRPKKPRRLRPAPPGRFCKIGRPLTVSERDRPISYRGRSPRDGDHHLLGERFPEHGFSARGLSAKGAQRIPVVIDPLDGTSTTSMLSLYAVSIGLDAGASSWWGHLRSVAGEIFARVEGATLAAGRSA